MIFNGVNVAPSDFNPRTHEECDLISSHALEAMVYFNPRTHEECDMRPCDPLSQSLHFNPRTHEECDNNGGGIAAVYDAISIHALTRSATHPRGVHLSPYQISIHALTRSATSTVLQNVELVIFQSTHSRGVRRDDVKRLDELVPISIHALTRSATR